MIEQSYLDRVSVPRHGGRIRKESRQRGLDPDRILDFSANMNPLGPPSSLESLIAEAVGSLSQYPDDLYRRFRLAVVDFLNATAGSALEPGNVVPANGSVEAFRLILWWLKAIRGENVMVPFPTFSEYELQSKLLEMQVDRSSYEEVLDLDMKSLDNYNLVFLCNPNNPTGTLRRKNTVKRFLERCQAVNTYLVVDEAFIELSDPNESVVDLVSSYPNLLVVRSLTKAFSIPGLRIGYVVGSKTTMGRIEKLRPPWNVNSLASLVGSTFVKENKKLLADSRQYLAKERRWLRRKLNDIGFSPYPGEANYLLCDAKPLGIKAEELREKCLDEYILIRNADSFYGLDSWHVRFAIKKREANRKLVSALKKAIPGAGRKN